MCVSESILKSNIFPSSFSVVTLDKLLDCPNLSFFILKEEQSRGDIDVSFRRGSPLFLDYPLSRCPSFYLFQAVMPPPNSCQVRSYSFRMTKLASVSQTPSRVHSPPMPSSPNKSIDINNCTNQKYFPGCSPYCLRRSSLIFTYFLKLGLNTSALLLPN